MMEATVADTAASTPRAAGDADAVGVGVRWCAEAPVEKADSVQPQAPPPPVPAMPEGTLLSAVRG